MYRISELNQLDRKIFHTNDLAILWGIADKHNLYMTVTRYIDKGILFPIYKGLYATVPVSSLNPLELGRAIIHRYAYLSTETVLSQAGIISQIVFDITFVADKSMRVSVGGRSFRFRKLKGDFLHNPTGITNQNGIFVASIERAVADMLYFSPRYHLDGFERVDFEKVRSMQKEIGYPC
jgi:hypothetical protein